MERVRIACVRYLNTAPLVEGLTRLAGVELTTAVPSRIADLVLRGDADVGLVSLIDAFKGDRALALVPVGMIGCDGPTLTVRLFSARPFSRIDVLHADTDSHTSTSLACVLLDRMHGIRPRIVDFDARERTTADEPRRDLSDWPETVLLIGNKVVTDAPPAERYPHQLDLGQAWKELTGLPFVYAMWMCRADDVAGPAVATAAAVLDRQLRHNLGRLDWIARRRAPEHRWPVDVAREYLGRLLRFQVGEREREAVARFASEAARLGLAEAREPEWVEWDRPLAAPAGA